MERTVVLWTTFASYNTGQFNNLTKHTGVLQATFLLPELYLLGHVYSSHSRGG